MNRLLFFLIGAVVCGFSYALEDQSLYPAYVDSNHYGLCLRASKDLEKGTIVATADLERTDKDYRAGQQEYIHLALMEVLDDGTPIYGNVRGNWRFCNHSCDPNCDISINHEIITNRAVKQGQELTTSYDAYIVNFPWPTTWNFVCECKSPLCKGVINKYRFDILDPITLKKQQKSYIKEL